MRAELRVRGQSLTLAVATIALGLVVHLHGSALGAARQDFAGDTLWASMIMWWIGVLAPSARLSVRSVVALAVCFMVETSQLYHTPTLDAIRGTTLGHLALGSGFDPRDLVACTAGVLAAAIVERMGAVRR
jgi:hypothetical protein